MTWSDFWQGLTAGAFVSTSVLGWMNWRKTKQIAHNTNSLSERNEAIAKKLGVAEGKAEEKANPS